MIKYLFRKVNLCESAANGGQNPAPPGNKELPTVTRTHICAARSWHVTHMQQNETKWQQQNCPTIKIQHEHSDNCHLRKKHCNPHAHSHPRCANVTSNRKLRDQRRTPRMRNRALQAESAMETHKQCAENKIPGTRMCAAWHVIACYINLRESLHSFMLPI